MSEGCRFVSQEKKTTSKEIMAANEIRYDNMCIANYFARAKEDILSAHIRVSIINLINGLQKKAKKEKKTNEGKKPAKKKPEET